MDNGNSNTTSQNQSAYDLEMKYADLGKNIISYISKLPTSFDNSIDAINNTLKNLSNEIRSITQQAIDISRLSENSIQNNPNIDTNRLYQNEREYYQAVDNRYRELNQQIDINNSQYSKVSEFGNKLNSVGINTKLAKSLGVATYAVDVYTLGETYKQAYETGDYKLAGKKLLK